jgi:hypothetical protein
MESSRTSQPLAALPSQSAKPSMQSNVHVPLRHAGTALAGAAVQALSQLPQRITVEVSGVSQPLNMSRSQSPKPVLHCSVQVLDAQPIAAFGRDGHRLPHAPQFAGSTVMFVQMLPHSVDGAIQPATQDPATHEEPAAHATPQRPQWRLLMRRSTSQPSSARALQFAKLATHDPSTHTLLLHDAVALAKEQTLPQRPQFTGFVRRSTMHKRLPHRSKCSAQSYLQTPDEHRVTLFTCVPHVVLHAPQCAMSSAVSMHKAPQRVCGAMHIGTSRTSGTSTTTETSVVSNTSSAVGTSRSTGTSSATGTSSLVTTSTLSSSSGASTSMGSSTRSVTATMSVATSTFASGTEVVKSKGYSTEQPDTAIVAIESHARVFIRT